MKKEISTVIEITDAHFKILQSKLLRSKKIISSCDVRAVHDHTDNEISKIITETILSKTIRPDDTILILPRRHAILKQMRLPAQNDAEIKKMAGLQLVNKIPFSVEDVIYDYHIIEREVSGYIKILVIIIHREVVEKYLKLFNNIGVNLSRFTLSSLGLLGWVEFQQERKMKFSQPMMLVNIDHAHTEICFIHQKVLLFSRSVNYGARDMGSDHMIGLVSQLELSLGSYKKDALGPDIEKIIVLTSLNDLAVIRDKIEKELKMVTEVFTSFENVLSDKKLNLNSLKDQMGLSMSVGIGTLFTDKNNLVNLAPPEIYDSKITSLRKRKWIQGAALVLLTFLGIVGYFGYQIYEISKELTAIEDQVNETKIRVKAAQGRIDFVKYFNEAFSDRVLIPELMAELVSLTPKEISFRSVSLNEKGQFEIQGYAQTSASVNDFQSKLVRSKTFQAVNLEFATKRRIFNMEVTDFKIVSQLKQEKDNTQ